MSRDHIAWAANNDLAGPERRRRIDDAAEVAQVPATLVLDSAQDMQTNNIWDALLTRIESKVNRHSFHTWFKPTSFVAEDSAAITVSVPNTLFKEWLTKHYSAVVLDAMKEMAKGHLAVNFVVNDQAGLVAIPDEIAASETAPPPTTPGPRGLNPRYTFDTFIVGTSNQFVHAACRAVAEAPSRSYNPLFIYGGVGLGKTHLMHAIGQYALQSNPSLKLTYLSVERFMNEMIDAVRYDRVLAFRERYRTVDVLLIDDVQFLAGKEGTQMEFFHTFNALYDSQKQIVVSSDRPPHEIPALEERLRSRFEWGLIADIQPPDFETKVAIVKKKADAEAVRLPENVVMYIARNVKSNIRELEGSLIRLIAYASLTGQEVSLALAQDVLKNIFEHVEKAVTTEIIQQFVAEYYALKRVDLKSRNNAQSVAMPRQIAMYLCKMLTHASIPDIGLSFGGKHPSTVLHAIRKVEDRRKSDADFNNLIIMFSEASEIAPLASPSPTQEQPQSIVAAMDFFGTAGLDVEVTGEAEFVIRGTEPPLAAYLPAPVIVVVDRTPDVSDVTRCVDTAKEKATLGPGDEHLIVLGYRDAPDPAARGQIAVERSNRRVAILPLSLDEMERALATGPGAVRKSLANAFERYVGGRDLFDERTAVADELLAFGRSGLVARIRSAVEKFQSVGVFGLRKTGKTTLLNQLRWNCRHLPSVIVDLQFEAAFSPSAGFREVLFSLERLARRHKVADLVSAASDRGQFIGKLRVFAGAFRHAGLSPPIVLCLDEPERILPLSTTHQTPAALARRAFAWNRFFGVLRAAAQEGLLALVVTDIRPEVTRLNDWGAVGVDTNPIYLFLQEEHLSMLTEEETHEMIAEIAGLMGREFEHDALEVIAAESGGHPFVARQLASLAICASTERCIGAPHMHKVVNHALDESETLDAYLRDLCSDVIKRGGVPARRLLSHAALAGGLVDAAEVHRCFAGLDEAESRKATRALRELGLIVEDQDKSIRSTMRLLDRYLKGAKGLS